MQKHTTKRILAGGVLITAALFLSSCRETAEAEAEPSENVLVVGCDDYTPFSYMDVNGNLTGIDVELAREAFSRMGYEAEVTFINWEDKKKLLADGTIDCVWSSFTMDGREEEYRWAGPYMKSNQVVAVNMDSDIWSVSDLERKTIAVQSTTKPEELFRTHADGIPAFRKIISVKKRDLIFTFLSKGYVDAIAAHDTSITQFMADFDMELKAFEEAAPGTFDAILMDIMMPVMDGLSATRAIRALSRPDAKTIPIVAMTANSFQEDVQNCTSAGMNAHLAKPLDMEKAAAVLGNVIKKDRPS